MQTHSVFSVILTQFILCCKEKNLNIFARYCNSFPSSGKNPMLNNNIYLNVPRRVWRLFIYSHLERQQFSRHLFIQQHLCSFKSSVHLWRNWPVFITIQDDWKILLNYTVQQYFSFVIFLLVNNCLVLKNIFCSFNAPPDFCVTVSVIGFQISNAYDVDSYISNF